MKTKLFTICLLLVTSQAFAETKSIQKLKDPDPIYVLERCAANSFKVFNVFREKQNKDNEEMEFQEIMKKRFNFFVDTLKNYHQHHDKFLSEEEITEKTLDRISELVLIISKEQEKPDFFEDTAFCKTLVKYN